MPVVERVHSTWGGPCSANARTMIGVAATPSSHGISSSGVPRQRCARTWTVVAAFRIEASRSSPNPRSVLPSDQSMDHGSSSNARPVQPERESDEPRRGEALMQDERRQGSVHRVEAYTTIDERPGGTKRNATNTTVVTMASWPSRP